MRRLTTPQRAIGGAITLVLIVALGFFGMRVANGVLSDDYRIEVVLGEIGQGVVANSDVVMRGVIVGRVGGIRLDEDLAAVAELILEPRYPVPRDATFAVTGKTLLGDKQIEISFDGPFDRGPFFEEGVVVADPDRIVELQDVLAELDELFGAVDPADLATVINDGLGAFDGQGDLIARAVDQGARAADVGARSLDDQIAALRDLSLVAEALGPQGDEFNRLGANVVEGLPTLIENQEEIEALLASLERFSTTFDATLEIDRANIDRMIVEGDNVTRMLFAYAEELGQTVSGLVSYTGKFAGGGLTHPNYTGEAAPFQVLITNPLGELCHEAPPELAAALPFCAGAAGASASSPEASASQPAPPVVALPGSPDLARPEVPARAGLEAVLDGTLRSLGLSEDLGATGGRG